MTNIKDGMENTRQRVCRSRCNEMVYNYTIYVADVGSMMYRKRVTEMEQKATGIGQYAILNMRAIRFLILYISVAFIAGVSVLSADTTVMGSGVKTIYDDSGNVLEKNEYKPNGIEDKRVVNGRGDGV
jgi:hypothetical protein